MKLDVGCGVRKQKGHLGVDLDKSCQVDVLADAQHLPFRSSSIDAIYSRRCLQHIPCQQLAVQEMNRVLVKGGTIHVIMISWVAWVYFYLVYKFMHSGANKYCHLCTEYTIKRLFKRMCVDRVWKAKSEGARMWEVHLEAHKV